MIVHRRDPDSQCLGHGRPVLRGRQAGLERVVALGRPDGSGAVGSGPCEIFLCRGGPRGRGKGKNTSTFASFEDETQDKGCWMSWWVEDVDAVMQSGVTQASR